MLAFLHTKTQTNGNINLFAVILFFIIFIPTAFNPAINSISLYVLIPILFIYSVIKNPKLILNYKPLIYLLLLLGWSLITMTMSEDLELSLGEVKQITGVFFLCYIFVHFSFANAKYIIVFYFLYVIRFIYIFYYATRPTIVT